MTQPFVPVSFRSPQQLQQEFDARLAEAEIAISFYELTATRCERHLQPDPDCLVCRLTLAWAVFKQFWQEEADKAHKRVLQVKDIATTKGQEEYIRASERELMYVDFFAKPEQIGSKTWREKLAQMIRDVKLRLSAVQKAIIE